MFQSSVYVYVCIKLPKVISDQTMSTFVHGSTSLKDNPSEVDILSIGNPHDKGNLIRIEI